eukprot:4930833-Prymnesium_polylepis.1
MSLCSRCPCVGRVVYSAVRDRVLETAHPEPARQFLSHKTGSNRAPAIGYSRYSVSGYSSEQQ